MTQDSTKRDALIEQYHGYVMALAAKLSARLGLTPDKYEECVSAGYMGLIEAAERYDESEDAHFKSFAYLRIRGAMIDELRNASNLSPAAFRYVKALNAYNEYREDAEACIAANGTEKVQLNRALQFASQGALAYRLCLDSDIPSSDLVDDSPNPEQSVLSEERHGFFRTLVEKLPERERFIVEQYYFEEKSFSEIADMSDSMSKSWVSRLHVRALGRLQRLLEKYHEEV